MAIKQLSTKQIQEWSLEQKDKWWRIESFKGDIPQLTYRSGSTGMVLGALLSNHEQMPFPEERAAGEFLWIAFIAKQALQGY